MKNNRLKALVAVVLVLFFAASLVQADALDDLIASYSFDYDSGEIDVGNVSDSLAGDVFSFDVDVISADSGDYVFYVDVEDVGGIVSGSSVVNLDSVGEIVRVNVSSYLLSGVSEFNYSLRVYDSGDFLVYEKSGFVSKVYSDYDSGIEILEINDYAFGDDYILFNVSFNSSVAVLENVTMFLEYDDEVISLIGEVSFGVGVNYVVFGIDSDTILYTHHNGTYNVSRILVGEKLFVVDYTTGSYNYVDFVEGSFLYGVDNYYVDSDNDSLIDYLEIEFQIEVREAGDYAVGAYVDSLDGVHITNISEEKYLEVGKQVIVARVNGSLIYSLGVNGPYGLSLAVLGKEEMWIDFMMDVYFDEEYSYLDFERPPLSDLEVVIIGRNVSVKNIGEADAFGIGVKVLNDSNERVFVIDELDVGEEYLFVVGFDENLTVIVDYDNFIDEENESNNVGFAVACVENLVNDSWSAWVDDGVCGVDDFQLQNRTVVEYDSNFCGEVSNVTYFEYQNVSCDFCTPNLINDSWSEWMNETACFANNTILQSRNRTGYDSNFCGEVLNVTYFEYNVTECGVVIDDVVPQFDSSSVVYDNVSLVSEFGVDVVGSNGSVYLNVDGVNYSAVGSGESYFVELNLSGGDYSCYWFAFGNGNDNLYGESGMFNYSVGVVEDEDDLDVNLISPVDGYVKRTSGSSYDVDFNFNVSGDFEISYCELIVGGEVRGRIDDVGRDALLEFVNIEVDRGSYDWKVRCVDVGEVEGISEVRGLKIARRSSSSSSSSSGRAYSDEPVLTEKVIPEEENVIYLGSGSGNGGNAMLGYGSFGDGSIVLNPVEEEVLFVRLVEWFFGFFR